MENNQLFRKIATVLTFIALAFSCSSSMTANKPESQPASKQKIVYGDLIVDPQLDFILIPIGLSGSE
ncbi:MAG: hypothetical protein ACM37W_07290, partial [Actinomycetota bacterium]